MEQLIKTSLLPTFTLTKLEAICGYFVFGLNDDEASIINMLLSMVRYHIWLARNSTRYENQKINFTECYVRFRYYMVDHIQKLIVSKYTKKNVKLKLSQILTDAHVIFRNGISQDDV